MIYVIPVTHHLFAVGLRVPGSALIGLTSLAGLKTTGPLLLERRCISHAGKSHALLGPLHIAPCRVLHTPTAKVTLDRYGNSE